MIELSKNERLHAELVPSSLDALVLETLAQSRGLLAYSSIGRNPNDATRTYVLYKSQEAAQHQEQPALAFAERRLRDTLSAGGAVIMLSGQVEDLKGLTLSQRTYAVEAILAAEGVVQRCAEPSINEYLAQSVALIEQELALQ